MNLSRESREEKGGTQRNVNEKERRKGTAVIEEGRGSEEWRKKQREGNCITS